MLYGDGRIFVLLSLAFYVFSIVVSLSWLWRALRKVQNVPREELPGVTIFKPLQGVDEELEENLESFARLDYPRLQLIFACNDPSDAALEIVRRLAGRHPERDILILAGTTGTACSPKVLNLEAMLPHARHELVMISDSNVRIAPTDLAALAAPFVDPKMGLVYQPVVGILDRSIAAALENLRLTESAGVLTMGVKQLLGLDVVMGKGMLMRRSALADIGDFQSVRDVAADDFVLGEAFSRAGWKLHLATVPARVVHIRWSLAGMVKRHTRHGAMRIRLGAWWTYPVEMAANPIAVALAGLALTAGKSWPWAVLAIVVKTTCELVAASCLRRQLPRWIHLPLVTVKDVLMGGIWFAAMFSRRVHWRGKTYRMGRMSRLELLEADAAALNRTAPSQTSSMPRQRELETLGDSR